MFNYYPTDDLTEELASKSIDRFMKRVKNDKIIIINWWLNHIIDQTAEMTCTFNPCSISVFDISFMVKEELVG